MKQLGYAPAKKQINAFTGATTQANGDSGLVPQPLIADKDKYLKGNGTWDSVPNPSVMIGADGTNAGTSGLVPAPAATDNTKFLKGNGTWAIPGMTILSYGNSSWNDFIAAYNANSVVYCRASSNTNPATGDQTRLAFMAYVNAATPTNVEFQYYRSVNSHSATQQGDQMYVYKLTSGGVWSVTVRESYTKIVAGTNLSSSYSNGVMTLTGNYSSFTGATSQANGEQGLVPAPLIADADKYLKGDGSWAAVQSPTVMVGADGTNSGTAGYVPAPAATDNTKYLKGDGSWDNVPGASVMTGADGTNAGTSGLVPAPSATDNTKFLKGNGTWDSVPSLPSVSSSDNGKFLTVVDGAWAATTMQTWQGGSY